MDNRAFRLISKKNTNNVLTVQNNSPFVGAAVQVWTNVNDLSSAWYIDNQGYIRNQAANQLCLATNGDDQWSQCDRFRDILLQPPQAASTWQIRNVDNAGGVRVLSDGSDLFLACWGDTARVVAQSSAPTNPMLNWQLVYLT